MSFTLGPIESERIRGAFAAMDDLRRAPQGTTAKEFLATMALASADGEECTPPIASRPMDDVANTIVFLG